MLRRTDHANLRRIIRICSGTGSRGLKRFMRSWVAAANRFSAVLRQRGGSKQPEIGVEDGGGFFVKIRVFMGWQGAIRARRKPCHSMGTNHLSKRLLSSFRLVSRQ